MYVCRTVCAYVCVCVWQQNQKAVFKFELVRNVFVPHILLLGEKHETCNNNLNFVFPLRHKENDLDQMKIPARYERLNGAPYCIV